MKVEDALETEVQLIPEKCSTFYTTGTHSARHQEMQRWGTHSPGVQGAQS